MESVGRKWSGALTCAAYNMHGKATAKLQLKVRKDNQLVLCLIYKIKSRELQLFLPEEFSIRK